MALLKLQHIQKTYSTDTAAFQCEHLAIDEGERIGIAGETGSGKSTLLKVIGGLEKPDTGEALFDQEPIYPKLDRLIPGHPQIAYLSQSFELPKFITVSEFLDSRQNDESEIRKIGEICHITELLNKDTRSLSGGERQRTALAKVLLKKPRVLLLDEPYSSLDPHHKRKMKSVIESLGDKGDMTIIMVSHHPTDLLPWADRVYLLKDGELAQVGSPKEIYAHPKDEYIAGLFGKYVVVDAEKWNIGKGELIVRPEQFCVNDDGRNGVVESVQYHGSHDILKVIVENETIQVREEVNRYSVGETIKLKLRV